MRDCKSEVSAQGKAPPKRESPFKGTAHHFCMEVSNFYECIPVYMSRLHVAITTLGKWTVKKVVYSFGFGKCLRRDGRARTHFNPEKDFYFVDCQASCAIYPVCTRPFPQFDEKTSTVFVGLVCKAGHGLTDTGAQSPVIGKTAALEWIDRLREVGLCPVMVKDGGDLGSCTGVGSSKIEFIAD